MTTPHNSRRAIGAYFGLIRTDPDPRIAGSPVAQAVERRRQAARTWGSLCLIVGVLGDLVLPNTTAVGTVELALLALALVLFGTAYMLKRRLVQMLSALPSPPPTSPKRRRRGR